MCGIAGAVGAIDDETLAALGRMHNRQRHRGPDADGRWQQLESDGTRGAAFAHRRLAIIDLSPLGRQPMTDSETGNVVCYNGEIYNFADLREELAALGRVFRSASDTEVILHAYASWGRACVTRFRGMFAFALWDAKSREVLLARDRLGKKPLYLAELQRPNGRVVLFASEVRALLASGLLERRLSPAALESYLWNGFVVGPQTIVRDIRELPAATTLTLDDDGRSGAPWRYWELPLSAPAPTDLVELEAELEAAVRMRLVSDVPLGIFLSGGIDSSAITALAARAGGAKLRTFNISFDEPEFDESRAAREVSRALGTEHSDIRLDEARFRAQLEPALASLDQPTFDAINTYFVSRAVREAGITVALSGAGGDELFGGYRSFVDVPRAMRWSRVLAPLPNAATHAAASVLARVLLGRAGEVPPQTRWGKLADALACRGNVVDAYQVSYALFTTDFLRELSGDSTDASVTRGLPSARHHALCERLRSARVLPALSALELSFFVGERLLRDTDATSMAVSLEARVPLLDHRVVELAAGLPDHLRYAPLGRKRALRQTALRALDPAIFERPKAGFELPLGRWLRAAATGEVDAALTDPQRCESVGLRPEAVARLWRAFRSGSPGLYWSRVWAIFALLHWARQERVTV